MRTTFLNLILLFVIVGCKQPTINKVQQAVEAQAKLLVDSGFFSRHRHEGADRLVDRYIGM